MIKLKMPIKSQIPNPNDKINSKSKFQNKSFNICALCLFWILCFGIWTYTSAEDKIVAIINSDIITQKDLDDFVNFMRIQLQGETKGKELESRIQSMKLDLIDRLIEDRLILQEAKTNNIKIDANRIKAKLEEIKRHYPSDAEFQNVLRKQGLVQADLELKMKEQLLMREIVESKVKSKITVRPGEVTDFYQKNSDKFKLSEQRRLEAVSIEDENLANQISADLKNGRRFDDLPKKYSLSVNRFEATQDGRLKKDIEDAVFKLNLHQLSEPIKIENKYYIFKVDDIIAPRQQTLPEVQEKIYALLFENKMQEELTAWLDGLKKHSYIKISAD